MSKGSRKSSSTRRGSLRLLQRVWSPFNHLLRATGESVQNVGSTAGRIVKESVGLPRRLGSRISKHSNNAIGNVFRRGGGNANMTGAKIGGGNANKMMGGSRKKSRKASRGGAKMMGGSRKKSRKASRKAAKKSRKASRR